MSTQLIKIDPNGAAKGLQFKKKGINLQSLGKARTKRVTDIRWDDDRQAWKIVFLMGSLGGKELDMSFVEKLKDHSPMFEVLGKARGSYPIHDAVGVPCGTIFWDDYDDAVTAEVEFIQQTRKESRDEEVGDA